MRRSSECLYLLESYGCAELAKAGRDIMTVQSKSQLDEFVYSKALLIPADRLYQAKGPAHKYYALRNLSMMNSSLMLLSMPVNTVRLDTVRCAYSFECSCLL